MNPMNPLLRRPLPAEPPAAHRVLSNPNRAASNRAAAAPTPSHEAVGHILLCNVFLRYRVHLPPVLRGTSLVVEAGSKLALCGRTGSGKSSVLGAL